MVKDDVDKENLVFQYTDNSKEVSVNLMIVLHINTYVKIVYNMNLNIWHFYNNFVLYVFR